SLERGPLTRGPEARAPGGAPAVQADVHVVAVGERLIDVPAPPTVAVVTDGIRLEHRGPGPPRLAVPDDLLDAHPARERLGIAEPVGRQQHADQARGRGSVARIVHVEMPIERAALAIAPTTAAGRPMSPRSARRGTTLSAAARA